MKYSEDDIASNAMTMLSATSMWVLIRHQWLIAKMRSILTGEEAPSLDSLLQFDNTLPKDLKLPENLLQNYQKLKQSIENAWQETTKSSHPLSGQSTLDQLNAFQQLANKFMRETNEFNQQLWHDFTMRDPLTGAWTRLTLKSTLTHELDRVKRYHLPCTLALLDQNEFKKINDKWGHGTGDMVLAETAELIQNNLRPSDKLFRYGGDEWLIVMPGTTEEAAKIILERILDIVAAVEFESVRGDLFNSQFSYGVAMCNNYTNTEDWIAEADKGLYLAKELFRAKAS